MNAFRPAPVALGALRFRDRVALERHEEPVAHGLNLAVPHVLVAAAPVHAVSQVVVKAGLAARGFGHGIAPFSSCQYNSGMVWKRLEPISSAFKRMARTYEAIESECQS
jgi:hypothetical protein